MGGITCASCAGLHANASYLSWLQGAAERISMPLYGFVWEERWRIVGNLSLIPLYRRGKVFYLIANVAVHPDYRRRGIGRQLTQTALDHLRQRGIDSAWLQVRDDNPGAYDLYRSLGFVERARRTTWLASPQPLLLRHFPRDYHPPPAQRGLAAAVCLAAPGISAEVAWNLPLHPSRFSPGLWNRLLSFLRGEEQEHWTARRGSDPIGFLTWEPVRTSTDLLWLAAPVQEEEQAILSLLPYARETLCPPSPPAFDQLPGRPRWRSLSRGRIYSSPDPGLDACTVACRNAAGTFRHGLPQDQCTVPGNSACSHTLVFQVILYLGNIPFRGRRYARRPRTNGPRSPTGRPLLPAATIRILHNRRASSHKPRPH